MLIRFCYIYFINRTIKELFSYSYIAKLSMKVWKGVNVKLPMMCLIKIIIFVSKALVEVSFSFEYHLVLALSTYGYIVAKCAAKCVPNAIVVDKEEACLTSTAVSFTLATLSAVISE